jgi:threonine/homoserine/homoserine lactone efflux protein
MFRVFFEGIILGLLVAVTLGPAFFTIIQTGIERGFKSAFYTALGIRICDFFLIVVCYLGFSTFDSSVANNKLYIGFTGGIILIIYGTYTYLKKPDILKRRSAKYKTPPATTRQYIYIIKGFFLNIANPFIILFWLTAMGWVAARAEGKLIDYVIIFFSGTLITTFGTDLLKSFVGNKIKSYLRPRVQFRINRILGIALIVSGIVLMVRVIWKF